MNPLEILLNADAASLGVRQSVPFLQAPGDTSTVGPRTTLSNKALSSGFDTLLQLRATWELPKLSCLGHTQCQWNQKVRLPGSGAPGDSDVGPSLRTRGLAQWLAHREH